MGSGLVCYKKDNKDEIELLSNKENNLSSNYAFSNYIYFKKAPLLLNSKKYFINKIIKIGTILNTDISFYIPNKIKTYIEENPFEDINSNNSTNDSDKENIHFEKPIRLKNNNIIYIGEWTREGIINGKGKMYKPETKTYIEGEWIKGCLNFGRIINFENIYIGFIRDNLYNGKGILSDFNGNSYEGNFLLGLKNGEGTYIYSDGCEYKGNYKNNEMNGYGIFNWNNNIYYKGYFYKGIFNGYGILKWNNGDIYNGQFKKGFFNGKGIYLWKNENEYYKGDYINNIKNGKGLYLFNNGNIYIGQWINGKPSGKGAYETKNKIYNGIWKNGSFIKLYDVISKYQSEEINENINFNFFTNTENIDINNLEHISTKNIPEII